MASFYCCQVEEMLFYVSLSHQILDSPEPWKNQQLDICLCNVLKFLLIRIRGIRIMVFNATFNNISVIS
jgi:hypothetical protein